MDIMAHGKYRIYVHGIRDQRDEPDYDVGAVGISPLVLSRNVISAVLLYLTLHLSYSLAAVTIRDDFPTRRWGILRLS